jgi:hypothetical protein
MFKLSAAAAALAVLALSGCGDTSETATTSPTSTTTRPAPEPQRRGGRQARFAQSCPRALNQHSFSRTAAAGLIARRPGAASPCSDACSVPLSAEHLFAGSSNLAAGGENQNGDNLIAIHDARIATAYAVEAIGLIDHYRFRVLQQASDDDNPLRLKHRSEHWATAYFDPTTPKYRERRLFAGEQHPQAQP